MNPLAFKAFLFGLLSAASLPLGASLALRWKPSDKIIAMLMAFGGGALLAALTIDLVAETVEKGDFYSLALGAVLGGFLFVILNQTVNSNGGFLRKMATTVNHLKKKKLQDYKRLFLKMSRIQLFHHLPPEKIRELLPHIKKETYQQGETIFKQGDLGDSLFIIESGKIDITEEKEQKKIGTLKENDVIGAFSLISGEPRHATAVAANDTQVWIIMKKDFDRLLEHSPELADSIKELISKRIAKSEEKSIITPKDADKWVKKAEKTIDTKLIMPTESEIEEAAKGHSGAPLAIWLGILLDGIPESLVIGSSLIHAHISISLIAGLFLSNFPEALSSSVGMREQRYSYLKILGMWTSLMIITGVGAYFGNIFFGGAPNFLFALIDGMAAGAMLTMIAETMLPEAFYKGGSITGLSCLFGFLAAIFFKTLE